MEKIEIRFSEVMQISGQLSEAAAAVKALENGSLQQIHLAAKNAFQSENAELLCKKEVRLYAQILQEADTLQKLAQDLGQRAKEMYRSESINRLLAKTRSY